MSKFKDLSTEIIKGVGGKENVENVTHCLTRLRFDLKDFRIIDEEKLKSLPGVISTARAGGKFQVIVGNSVNDVYTEVVNQLNIAGSQKVGEEKVGILTAITNTITKVITPTLGVLIAAGLLKGVVALLQSFNLISPDSGTLAILNALGDALFYFFPIILGYTSAETFGLNKFIGMILGAVLIYPGIGEALAGETPVFQAFTGTPFELTAYKTFLGMPIVFPMAGYSSTVIPIILINWFASKVEKFLKNSIPDIVGFAFVPFLTLILVTPLSFLVIGPIANILQSIIGWAAMSVYNFSPILAAILIALIYQPLVIFGLHWPLITLAITNFGSLGYDYIWPMMFSASFAQTAAVMAIGLKSKNKKTKAMAVPATISGLMCIIEPAIYGFTLPDKKRFLFSMIGGAAGAVIITLFKAVQYSLGIGLLGFSGFLNPNGDNQNVIIAAIGVLVTMVVTFALVWITYKDEAVEN